MFANNQVTDPQSSKHTVQHHVQPRVTYRRYQNQPTLMANNSIQWIKENDLSNKRGMYINCSQSFLANAHQMKFC